MKHLLCRNFCILKLLTEEESVTKEEIQEEWDFIDACLDTKVMDITRDFLVSKGITKKVVKIRYL